MKGSIFSILIPCIQKEPCKKKNYKSDKILLKIRKTEPIFEDTNSNFKNFSNLDNINDCKINYSFEEYLKPKTSIHTKLNVNILLHYIFVIKVLKILIIILDRNFIYQ